LGATFKQTELQLEKRQSLMELLTQYGRVRDEERGLVLPEIVQWYDPILRIFGRGTYPNALAAAQQYKSSDLRVELERGRA
jgi:hypothetical protein